MDPITAAYAQDDADWTITVSGLGKTLTARAPGIIAARDRADQLVDKLAPAQSGRTVVHLLNGSALEFTATYMQARLSRTPGEEAPTTRQPAPGAKTAEPKKAPRKPASAKPAAAKPKRTKPAAKRTAKPAQPSEEPAEPPVPRQATTDSEAATQVTARPAANRV